jgi:hypothetical protein
MEFSEKESKITEQYAEEQDQSSQSQVKNCESLDNIMLESHHSSGREKK